MTSKKKTASKKKTSKKKTTSKMKKNLKTPNPPKAQACMKTSQHEDNLHYAGLHTALIKKHDNDRSRGENLSLTTKMKDNKYPVFIGSHSIITSSW